MGKYTDNKFGTTTPIVYNDKEYGELELDYFGNYDYEITDSKEFTKLYVETLKKNDVALENFEFVESKNARAASSDSSNYEPTPYDYQDSNSGVNVENDPFAEFGDSVSIDDNFLE